MLEPKIEAQLREYWEKPYIKNDERATLELSGSWDLIVLPVSDT